jgi:hypothetical protein
MRWEGHVECMGEERKVYKILMGKPKRKRPFLRPRIKWEDGIIIDLRETDWGWSGFRWLRIGTCERLL